ncbi:MAG TPA: SMC-Scp complex subunit ScpB [Lacipirellulaceae bacterium]|nr:SMC-Scp complex subunit ScpB [Lacipirellulaceae bacterium]
MSRAQQPSEVAASEATAKPPSTGSTDLPLSLTRLREAFAAMLGEQEAGSSDDGDTPARTARHGKAASGGPCLAETSPRHASCEISPRSILEAMLFVGRPGNEALSARELAAAMRGVSPNEVDAAVGELNAVYDADGTPYRIEHTNSGYRMVLRSDFERIRDKFYGRVKEARLSPAVMEVLSILAYNQPATAEKIAEIRGAASGAALATLVRRRLAKLSRPADSNGPPLYSTTDRFLKLFRLESLAALPRAEDLEKA